jgi:hypothetical protein
MLERSSIKTTRVLLSLRIAPRMGADRHCYLGNNQYAYGVCTGLSKVLLIWQSMSLRDSRIHK